MPPVRSVRCADNLIEFTDFSGIQKTLLANNIPSGNNTVAKIETYINDVWIPANVTGYQMRAHVFSRLPLRVTVGTWNFGITILESWWLDV